MEVLSIFDNLIFKSLSKFARMILLKQKPKACNVKSILLPFIRMITTYTIRRVHYQM